VDFLKLVKFYGHVDKYDNKSRISIIVIQVTKSNFPTTATSRKGSPTNDCDNDQQTEGTQGNMAAHTGIICVCGDIIWGKNALVDPPKNCDLCEKKKHWRYKPYSQCLTNGFEMQSLPWIPYCRNWDLPDWKTPKQHFAFVFRGHKCADVYEKYVIITAFLRKCMGYISSSKIYNISTYTNISG